MGWVGKLAFGSLGMLLGGPLGAISGAALRHALIDNRNLSNLPQTVSVKSRKVAKK